MSIHKSLNLGGGVSSQRSVFTRRERIERLMESGDFEEGNLPFGLPKVRTHYKVLSRSQVKALAAAEGAEGAEGTEAAGEAEGSADA